MDKQKITNPPRSLLNRLRRHTDANDHNRARFEACVWVMGFFSSLEPEGRELYDLSTVFSALEVIAGHMGMTPELIEMREAKWGDVLKIMRRYNPGAAKAVNACL